jgi:hypothetical protein
MAIENLQNVIAEHCTTLDFPIKYKLLKLSREVPFAVLVFHERQGFKDSSRSPASDMPFAIWKPDGSGLQSLSHDPYYTLVCAGLRPQMEEFCAEAYEALKGSDDAV